MSNLKRPGEIYRETKAGRLSLDDWMDWLYAYRTGNPAARSAVGRVPAIHHMSEAERAEAEAAALGEEPPVADFVHHKGGGGHYVLDNGTAPVRTSYNS